MLSFSLSNNIYMIILQTTDLIIFTTNILSFYITPSACSRQVKPNVFDIYMKCLLYLLTEDIIILRRTSAWILKWSYWKKSPFDFFKIEKYTQEDFVFKRKSGMVFFRNWIIKSFQSHNIMYVITCNTMNSFKLSMEFIRILYDIMGH